MKFQISSY